MAELTDATGAFHFVRVWSWSSLEVHAAGDALDLSHSDAGEPLTLTPVLLLFPEDAHILAPDVPFDGSGVASGGDAVSAGDARAGSPECYESGLMLAPELSGNVYLPTEVDGVRIGVAILQRDGDLLFWVEAHGGDRERARAALESLAINPQGAWTDAATALGLTPPAELEPRLAEFSTAVLEDGSTIERCPLRQATTSE
jgi:hypothetical protein